MVTLLPTNPDPGSNEVIIGYGVDISTSHPLSIKLASAIVPVPLGASLVPPAI